MFDWTELCGITKLILFQTYRVKCQSIISRLERGVFKKVVQIFCFSLAKVNKTRNDDDDQSQAFGDGEEIDNSDDISDLKSIW